MSVIHAWEIEVVERLAVNKRRKILVLTGLRLFNHMHEQESRYLWGKTKNPFQQRLRFLPQTRLPRLSIVYRQNLGRGSGSDRKSAESIQGRKKRLGKGG